MIKTKKFRVVIHYGGAVDFEVEAKDWEEAEDKAWNKFDKMTNDELAENIGSCDVCDCEETEDI